LGSCPATGNVFAGSPTVEDGVLHVIPVDVFVPGCPPRPQAILAGVLEAARLLSERRSGKAGTGVDLKESTHAD
jgi:Ni,Fe-hydrogenase III small subunit